MISKKKIFTLSVLVILFGISFWVGLYAQDNLNQAYEQVRKTNIPMQWESKDVTFQNEGMDIVGTLTVPKEKMLYPIILILHGFGGDRHGFRINGTDEGYFDRLARRLAEQGFGSLRIDFRGSGQSEGTFDITSFSGQKSDALAAIKYIKGLSFPIRTDIIGILGHSQGGIISSMIANSDKRVKSVVLWAAPAYPPHDYEGLFLKEGIKKGMILAESGVEVFPLYIDGTYLFDVNMRKQFFLDLFKVDPLVPISRFKKPLMYVSPLKDAIVWPQPQIGEVYMEYHDGYEKLVSIDSDHNFNYLIGPDQVDETINWTIAWFKETLKY